MPKVKYITYIIGKWVVRVRGKYLGRFSTLDEAIKMRDEYSFLALSNKYLELRQLLKECKDIIECYKVDTGYIDLPTENILTRINAAIGESEE